jgi:hypothetical protein
VTREDCSEFRRLPATVTREPVDSSIQISWPAARISARCASAASVGLPSITAIFASACIGPSPTSSP